MKVAIFGVDGYIGWPLAQYLTEKGFKVFGFDNLLKRRLLGEAVSVVPAESWEGRSKSAPFSTMWLDLACSETLKDHVPRVDAIVNLAQLPSAPYSMRSFQACELTQVNNIGTNLAALWFMHSLQSSGTAPHMVTLGTMGEYGTPNVDIPEGDFELEFRGRKDRLQFPRKPASFYHAIKVASSANCEFACRAWGLRVTDIMQGVVYGTRFPGHSGNSWSDTVCYLDEAWGTVINRFCAQAVGGHPLTVYGTGAQCRGVLPLADSLRCIELLLQNPAREGEYRVVNQFDKSYSILDMACTVSQVGRSLGLEVATECAENPRVEDADHYYNPDRQKLVELGYEPRGDLAQGVFDILSDMLPHKGRIAGMHEFMAPRTKW